MTKIIVTGGDIERGIEAGVSDRVLLQEVSDLVKGLGGKEKLSQKGIKYWQAESEKIARRKNRLSAE